MTSWFGHTQTVASISKTVTNVASGIIYLERNLNNFMCKVIYYEQFFQRHNLILPECVNTAVCKLFKSCYEYRNEIRLELESNIAYVADASRWVIGLEDWSTKMEKKKNQINELVLLTNTLLTEYSITGKIGGMNNGSNEDLNSYINVIMNSIDLNNDDLNIDKEINMNASIKKIDLNNDNNNVNDKNSLILQENQLNSLDNYRINEKMFDKNLETLPINSSELNPKIKGNKINREKLEESLFSVKKEININQTEDKNNENSQEEINMLNKKCFSSRIENERNDLESKIDLELESLGKEEDKKYMEIENMDIIYDLEKEKKCNPFMDKNK